MRSLLLTLLFLLTGITGVWGQFTLTTADDVTNGTEKLYWIEANSADGFYMIPDPNNTNASTTNMPNLKALWYFMDAGIDDGKQYYYVVNHSTRLYLKLIGTLGAHNSIGVGTNEGDLCKFFVVASGTKWALRPKSGVTTHTVNKRGSNVSYQADYTLKSSTAGINDPNSMWDFIPENDVQWAHPFINSTSSEKHYYNIHNATTKGAAYYISTDDNSDPYATISNENNNKRIWYFVEAASDNSIPNLKYYYIVNAVTGKYLKFTGTANGNTQANSLRLYEHTGSETGETEERFQFMVLNAIGEKYSAYSIMPKLEISYYNNKNASLSPSNSYNNTLSNDMKIGIYNDRGQNNNYAHWLFEVTDYVAVEAPTITNNFDGTISLSTTTTGATIYYTTNGNTPDNTSTAYSSAFQLGNATVIKAIAYVGSVSSDVTTYNVPQYDAPNISFNSANSQVTISGPAGATIYYTTNGGTPTTSSTLYSAPFTVSSGATIKAIATHAGYLTSTVTTLTIAQVATPTIQNNGSNAISITCATEGATIYYTTDGSTPTTGSTLYTEPLTENVSGVTIKAIAVKENMIPSAVGSGSVTLQCASPVIVRNGNNGFTVSCPFPSSGVTIYYTIDGSTPTSSSNSTTSGGTVTATLPVTVKAMAVATGYNNSTVATVTVSQGMGGDGSAANPYTIENQSDITDFITKANTADGASKHYKVIATDPLDFNGVSAITQPFSGTFDGGLQTITNLGHALFNTVNGGTVKNVILKNVTISSGTNVGAICNEATGASRIYNCGILATTEYDTDGNITGFSGSSIGGSGNVGGIVGLLSGNARVINCYSYATITGGTTVGGIVGNIGYGENQSITQATVNLKPMVVNCMFYGDITGGTSISPVYGGASGAMIKNETIETVGSNEVGTGVNPYCYFRGEASFNNTNNFPDIESYKRSWPAEEKNLTRFEYYRSILNSNKRLCTYWITDKVYGSETEPTGTDEALVAKWVLDPSIAPYPILKKWGKYPSIINPDPEKRIDPSTKTWINRDNASSNWEKHGVPDTEGQILGGISVSINAGDHHNGTASRTINITAMDKEYHDYCYGKIQLPYYNEIFGNPDGSTWSEKYGDNYGEYVVTGWEITATDGSDASGHSFSADWQDGYNFADRKCVSKDLYGTSGRVFAQGGYYYVPEGVSAITITAHWGKAVYLANRGHSIDRVRLTKTMTADSDNFNKVDLPFSPAGTVSDKFLETADFAGYTVYNDLQNAIKALGTSANYPTVYDQAIVLIGNHQVQNASEGVGYELDSKWHPFTIMSADFDFDNEPDYCLELQFRRHIDRPGIQPIRFDFLPVVELGLAVRPDKNAYAIGIFIPQGHFEITETSFMRNTQFEWDCGQQGGVNRIADNVPVILNGGEFEQLSVRYTNNVSNNGRRTGYFLLGGHLRFHRFAPGAHPHKDNTAKPRLCAVNAIGGDFPEFYLSGLYKPDLTPHTDQGNPHCYIDGGNFGSIHGAGYDKVNGSVTFKVNHSIIGEFYGGGINGSNPVGGDIDVYIDNSKVTKYCGGPEVGIMTGKTVTTHATGTTFDVYYGGGNGGNSYYRKLQWDGDRASSNIGSWNTSGNTTLNWGDFNPLGVYDDDIDDENKGYHAEYEFEVFNQSNGTRDQITQRGFIRWIQFGITTTGNVTNTLTDCTVNTNFFGGGNLATVDGTVTSKLTNTTVKKNVFGAGYSAAIPKFTVHDKANKVFPSMDFAGTITEGYIPNKQEDGKDIEYEWTNNLDGVAGHDADYMKAHPDFYKMVEENGTQVKKWYCYTWNPLVNLGVVTGAVKLTITTDGGASVIGTTGDNTTGHVYGGGDESAVKNDTTPASASTTVNISGNTQVLGNVYGGGNQGLVSGNTTVNIRATEPANP